MRIPVVIFATLVALCAVVLVLSTLDEPPDSRGVDHAGLHGTNASPAVPRATAQPDGCERC